MGRAAWTPGWRRRGDVVVALFGVVALVAAVAARRQAPWIPVAYLVTLPALVVGIWVVVRHRTIPTPIRITASTLAGLLLVALLPVPWMTATLDEPPGTAWRLDGRLTIDGRSADPAGDWYWLTVGRPPLVAEVVGGWFSVTPTPESMRRGSAASRPAFNEPAAAAVGLRAAGRPIELALVVEGRDPTIDGLPASTLITEINGIPVTSRDRWQEALDSLDALHTVSGDDEAPLATLVDGDGATHHFTGPDLPFRRTIVLDVPAEPLDAAIRGPLAGTPPERWFRGLALGRSHGLMIALVAYAHETGSDLADGRAIAGTGGIRGDGTVVRISGLRPKAAAAARAGADIMLYPVEQADELAGFDPGSMLLVPVADLDEAIAALSR